MRILFAPFTISLYTTNNNVAILICNGYFSAIRAPFHVLDNTGFAVIDHFLDPLSVVFHENDDGSGGVACCEFAILVVPYDNGNIASVVR